MFIAVWVIICIEETVTYHTIVLYSVYITEMRAIFLRVKTCVHFGVVDL